MPQLHCLNWLHALRAEAGRFDEERADEIWALFQGCYSMQPDSIQLQHPSAT
jgi:hypothetical protein